MYSKLVNLITHLCLNNRTVFNEVSDSDEIDRVRVTVLETTNVLSRPSYFCWKGERDVVELPLPWSRTQ
jgi:glucose-6-phosphate 1-dehydrogenase